MKRGRIGIRFLSALVILMPLLFSCNMRRSNILTEITQIDTVSLSQRDTVTLLIMGDIMQHITQLKSALKKGEDPELPQSYDYSFYFTHIGEHIQQSDYSIANMEFTAGVTPYSGYPQFSSPESLAEEAAKVGIDLFLCANNHICDKGKRGIESTIEVYNNLEIPFTGIYENAEDETISNPFIAQVRDIRIAFINFTYDTNGLPIPEPYKVNLLDSLHVKEVIMRAKQDRVDFIIALPHWGNEYELTPSAQQKEWQSMLYREGVNIIVGSHPHVPQPLDIERDPINITRLTLFSTGNLISNMDRENTQIGIMLRLKLSLDKGSGEKEIVSAEPIYTWCARAGKFINSFTVIPIEEYLHREDEFLSAQEYEKMKREYEKLTTYNIYDIEKD